MTWEQIADEQRRAAQTLLGKKSDKTPRAVCSRAYYAAYAVLAARAPAAMTFPPGWNNPSHHQIPAIVDALRGIPKQAIKQAINRLWVSRITSDYGVGQTVSQQEARQRLRDCAFVFREVTGR